MSSSEAPRFIVDINAGKLARWLRMMGYDTILYGHGDDHHLVRSALDQKRTIITRDTQIMKRRIITSGRLRALLVTGDTPAQQMRQVMEQLRLCVNFKPFSLCLDCNQPLEERTRESVADRVPPYVFRTQYQFVECPSCHRIYWKGTHWEAMVRRLETFMHDNIRPGDRPDAGQGETD